jgi:hypothetical protein
MILYRAYSSPTSGKIVIMTLINVEDDPGEYTAVTFACGPINKIYSLVHVIECVNMITYVLASV